MLLEDMDKEKSKCFAFKDFTVTVLGHAVYLEYARSEFSS